MVTRNKDKGFTLAELLVVVAIIAVLTAVSIPIFKSKLETARESTDQANMRAAKAAAVSAYLNEESLVNVFGGSMDTVTFGKQPVQCRYDAASGKLVSISTPVEGYGKGTKIKGGCAPCNFCYDYEGNLYNEESDVRDMYLMLDVATNGEVNLVWIPNY